MRGPRFEAGASMTSATTLRGADQAEVAVPADDEPRHRSRTPPRPWFNFANDGAPCALPWNATGDGATSRQ